MHYQNKQFVHFNIHVGKCSINLVTLLKAQYVILIKYPKTTITLFCCFVYFHYPKCFEECLNPEK